MNSPFVPGLVAPATSLLVSRDNVPIPPQQVVRRLEQLSPRLKIEWCAGAHRPYWGLKVRWPQGDPRWERVQTGEIPAAMAFDLDQMFPSDCAGEDMAAYVESRWGDRNLRSKADAAEEADRIVNDAIKRRSDFMDSATHRVAVQSDERFARETKHDREVRAGVEKAHPMVRGGLAE